MEGREAFALLMAMRTGKTKTLLDDFGRLEVAGQCEDLLVIAPAGVYRTWEPAIKEHLSNDLQSRARLHTWSASLPNKNDTLDSKTQNFLEAQDRPRILLVNVEALSLVKRARTLCETFTKQRRCMIAVDESTTIKTPGRKRTQFVLSLANHAAYRRILSGLPTPKSPGDLYAQFYFLDPTIIGIPTWTAFKRRYAITKAINLPGRQWPIKIIVSWRGIEQLRELIAPHSHRVSLEDCYDLPPKIYMIREVGMTPEQIKAYEEIKKFATTQLDSGGYVSAPQVITQLLRMHQVLCGHVGTEDGKHESIPEKRTDELLDVLSEYEGKAIIWCSYDRDVRKVSKAIQDWVEREAKATHGDVLAARNAGQRSVACFWGGNRDVREDEERRFLNDDDCSYMVATAAAGGRGRTWTVADLVVYYSNTPDLEHRSQSEERAQGINKMNSVAYVDLVVPGTVDEKMLKALRNKINMAAVINGDNYREWIV